MRHAYFFIAVLVLSVSVCSGQSPWKFRSDNYLGLDAGEIGEAFHVQTVNGLYKGPWFLGLGVGLDYYRFRSIPLFVSVRRDLAVFDSRSRLFLYLDGGINLPWYKRELTAYERQIITSSGFRAGPWGSAGMGYEWKRLLFSAGYSMKKLTERLTNANICMASTCQIEQQTYVYEYLNHTFLLLVGFRF